MKEIKNGYHYELIDDRRAQGNIDLQEWHRF